MKLGLQTVGIYLTALNVIVHLTTTVLFQEMTIQMDVMLTNLKLRNTHADIYLPTINKFRVGGNEAEYKLLV